MGPKGPTHGIRYIIRIQSKLLGCRRNIPQRASAGGAGGNFPTQPGAVPITDQLLCQAGPGSGPSQFQARPLYGQSLRGLLAKASQAKANSVAEAFNCSQYSWVFLEQGLDSVFT